MVTYLGRTRVMLVIFAVVALFGAVAAAGKSSHAATTPVPPFFGSTSANTSDPHLFTCNDPKTGRRTLCLVTSHDLGAQQDTSNRTYTYGEWNTPITNYYPMDYYYGHILTPGTNPKVASNWKSYKLALTESQLVADANLSRPPKYADSQTGKRVETMRHHLWAPAVFRIKGGWYIYVPDVADYKQQDTSSRIYVFKSKSDSMGTSRGWSYVGTVNTPSSPNGGYASDPMVANVPIRGGGRWLVYANGDFSNCGQLSIGEFASDDGVTLDRSTVHQLVIKNDSLGNCNGGPPYKEGPSLYYGPDIGAPSRSPWKYYLVYAEKPSIVPPACNNRTEGRSDREVIAYAVSKTVDGPYEFAGIILCGSKTEWTNQASLQASKTASGISVTWFAYHDGPASNQQDGVYPKRKVRLDCISWNSDGSIKMISRGAADFANCARA